MAIKSVLNWFRSYLSDLSHFVNVNNEYSAPTVAYHGVSQGSVLSPIQFYTWSFVVLSGSVQYTSTVLLMTSSCIYLWSQAKPISSWNSRPASKTSRHGWLEISNSYIQIKLKLLHKAKEHILCWCSVAGGIKLVSSTFSIRIWHWTPPKRMFQAYITSPGIFLDVYIHIIYICVCIYAHTHHIIKI